jgi:hypothetical protein
MEFEPMCFSPTYHGPFWEDEVFGAQIKSLLLKIVIFPKNLKNLTFIFSSLYICHVPAERAAYQNVCTRL